MATELVPIDTLVLAVRPQFEAVLADRSMNFAAEAEFALQQICKTDYALKVAHQNHQALRDAVTNVAAMGLTLNPALALAYLAPRDGKIQLLVGYRGLIHVAVESGAIRMAKAELVYSNDRFTPQGLDKQPLHEFNPFAESRERGKLVGVYVSAKTQHGDWITDWMTLAEVHSARARSESWKAHVASLKTDKVKSSPWLTDEGEMFKKTVIRRAHKTWPVSERLAKVMDHLNTVGEGIDLSSDADLAAARPATPADLLKAARAAADGGRAAFAEYWRNITPAKRNALRGEIDSLRERTSEAEARLGEPRAPTPPRPVQPRSREGVTDVTPRPARRPPPPRPNANAQQYQHA